MTNASNEIFPDKDNGVWVDDPNDGLPREPFVEGPDRMIHRVEADSPNAASAPGHFLAMGTVGLAARGRRRQLGSNYSRRVRRFGADPQ